MRKRTQTRRVLAESLEPRRLLAADAGDTIETATAIVASSPTAAPLIGSIGDGANPSNDIDFYEVYLDVGQRIAVDIDARMLDSGKQLSQLNSQLRVLDSAGIELAMNNTGRSPFESVRSENIGDSFLQFEAPYEGPFYIGVSGNGSDGIYHLSVVDVTPNVASSLNESPTVKGSRFRGLERETLEVAAPGFLRDAIDREGDDLVVSILTLPRFGDLTLLGEGGFRYEPFADYKGIDTFRYQLSDGIHLTEPVTVVLELLDDRDAVLTTSDLPNVIQVTSLANNPNDDATSLQEAVTLANQHTSSKNIIDLSNFDSYWIDDQLEFETETELIGGDSGTVISSYSDHRLVSVLQGAKVTIIRTAFSGRKLNSGDGGAIWSAGTLNLEEVHVYGAEAIHGSGGGIYNTSTGILSLSRSTVANNIASGDGGGIQNDAGGILEIINSTISGNHASGAGGGIRTIGDANITASTVAFNQGNAGSNLSIVGGLELKNSIVAKGLSSGDIVGNITSHGGNLVGNADSTVGLSPTNHDQSGTAATPLDPQIDSLQFNGGLTPTHLLLAASPAIDAGLDIATYRDQRGASRWIDGVDANPADRNRRTDIGSVEFGTFFVNDFLDGNDQTPLGDGIIDVDLSTPGNQVTLRAATQELAAMNVAATNSSEPQVIEGTILFDGPGSRTVVLSQRGLNENAGELGDLDLAGDVSIRANLTDRPTLDDGTHRIVTIRNDWLSPEVVDDHAQFEAELRAELHGTDRILHALPRSFVQLESLRIQEGFAINDIDPLGGAGILNEDATLIVTSSFIEQNVAKLGGGIYNSEGTTLIEGGTSLRRNIAADGGGLYVASGSVASSNSEVVENIIAHRGGAAFVADGSLKFREQTLVDDNRFDPHLSNYSNLNASVIDGRAVYVAGGQLDVSDSTISNNFRNELMYYHPAELIPLEDLPMESPYLQSSVIFTEVGTITKISNSSLTDHTSRHDSALYLEDNEFDPVVIMNSGILQVDGSEFTRNDRLLVNFREGQAFIHETDMVGNHAGGGLTFGSGLGLQNTWLGQGNLEYNNPIPDIDDQTYGATRLIAASIQNHGGQLEIVQSVFSENNETSGGEYNDGGEHAVVNVGIGANLRVVESTFANNRTDNFPVVLNLNGTLDVQSSTFDHNVSTGLEERWVGAIQHLGHGQYIGSTETFLPKLVASRVPGEESPSRSTVRLDSVAALDPQNLPIIAKLHDETVTITSIDPQESTVTFQNGMYEFHQDGTELRSADSRHSFDGLFLTQSVDADDAWLTVADATPFSRFSLPMPIVVGNEPMLVTAVEPNLNRLVVQRSYRNTHVADSRVQLHNEFSGEIAIEEPERFEHHQFPMEMVIAVYEERNVIDTERYTFHERITPGSYLTDLAAENRISGPELPRSVNVYNTGSSYGDRSIEPPEILAMEVVTVTGIDSSRGVLTVERGRQGTAPIRFDSAAHLWALPGGMTIHNSTFSSNALVPHFYFDNYSQDPDSLVYDRTQAMVRSEVSDFAVASVIENSTFSDNSSHGPVASIWSNRTSMFAGHNPVRYKEYDLDAVTSTGFPMVEDRFARQFRSITLENSVLVNSLQATTGTEGVNTITGQKTGQLYELPLSQQHLNFIDAKRASDEPNTAFLNNDDTVTSLQRANEYPGGLNTSNDIASSMFSDESELGKRRIDSGINVGHHVPRVAFRVSDDAGPQFSIGHNTDTVVTNQATGYGGEHTRIDTGINGASVSYVFQNVPSGTIQLSLSNAADIPVGTNYTVTSAATGIELFSGDAPVTDDLVPDSAWLIRDSLSSRPWWLVDNHVVLPIGNNNSDPSIFGDIVVTLHLPENSTVRVDALRLEQRSFSTWDGQIQADDGYGYDDDYGDDGPDQSGDYGDYEEDSNGGQTTSAAPSNEIVPGLTEISQCHSSGEIVEVVDSLGRNAWSIAGLAPGTYYAMTSWDATQSDWSSTNGVWSGSGGSHSQLVDPDSFQTDGWFIFDRFSTSGEPVTVRGNDAPGGFSSHQICIAEAAWIDFKRNDSSGTPLTDIPATSWSEQTREFALIGQPASITRSSVTQEALTTTWTFHDLTPGTYLVAADQGENAVASEYAFEIASIDHQINPSETALSTGTLGFRLHADDGTPDLTVTSREFTLDGLPSAIPDSGQNGVFREGESDFTLTPAAQHLGDTDPLSQNEWMLLDRVQLTGSSLTIRVDQSSGGQIPNGIRIERIHSADANLSGLSFQRNGVASHVPSVGSPVVDQGNEELWIGIHSQVTESLPASYSDRQLIVENAEHFVRSADNLNAPEFPYEIEIGKERLRLIGYDPSNDFLWVDRGVSGTEPEAHLPGEIALHGFAGLKTQLLEPLAPEHNSLLVSPLPIDVSKVGFEIQVGSEILFVTEQVDNFDGTWTLQVERELRGTSNTLPVPALATVLARVDQGWANRWHDGNGEGRAASDLGAAEMFDVTVNESSDLPDTNRHDGLISTVTGRVSLRAAVSEANRFGGKATIRLPAGQFALNGLSPDDSTHLGQIDITGFVAILGAGADQTTLDSADLERFFNVHPGATLYLEGLTLTGSSIGAHGSVIASRDATIVLMAVQITGNHANEGGAVHVNGGELSIHRSSFVNNSAAQGGGAIFVESGDLEIQNSTFSGNNAGTSGGAIYLTSGSTANLRSVTIAENTAVDVGGLHSEGEIFLQTSVIASNTGERPDVAGKVSSNGSNFIGVIHEAPTYVHSIQPGFDEHASVTVTDPSGLPDSPFSIQVNEHVFNVLEVRGNRLFLQNINPWEFQALAISPGAEVRFDGLWNDDQFGTSSEPANPLLAPLSLDLSNTLSHLPHANSPLVDAGPTLSDHADLVDQRGVDRYADATGRFFDDETLRIDIGAVERYQWLEIVSSHMTQTETDSGQVQTTIYKLFRSDGAGALTVNYEVIPYGEYPVEESDFPNDWMPTGTIVFQDGQTSVEITIESTGDDIVEHNESFAVALSQSWPPVNFRNTFSTGTLVNDDAVGFSIVGTNVNEDDGLLANLDRTPIQFEVELLGEVEDGFTVNFVASSAVDGIYGTTEGALEFAGDLGENYLLHMEVGIDQRLEPDQEVTLVLTQGSDFPDDVHQAFEFGSGTLTAHDDEPDTFDLDQLLIGMGLDPNNIFIDRNSERVFNAGTSSDSTNDDGGGSNNTGSGDGGYGDGGYGDGGYGDGGYGDGGYGDGGYGDGGYGDGGYGDGGYGDGGYGDGGYGDGGYGDGGYGDGGYGDGGYGDGGYGDGGSGDGNTQNGTSNSSAGSSGGTYPPLIDTDNPPSWAYTLDNPTMLGLAAYDQFDIAEGYFDDAGNQMYSTRSGTLFPLVWPDPSLLHPVGSAGYEIWDLNDRAHRALRERIDAKITAFFPTFLSEVENEDSGGYGDGPDPGVVAYMNALTNIRFDLHYPYVPSYPYLSPPLEVVNSQNSDDESGNDNDDNTTEETEIEFESWVIHEAQQFNTESEGPGVSGFQNENILADYEVSYRGELTFNPIAGYSIPTDVNLPSDAGIELVVYDAAAGWTTQSSNLGIFDSSSNSGTGYAGDGLESVVVNDDMSITFTPSSAQLSGTLLPRKNPAGHVYRYDTLRPVSVALRLTSDTFTEPLIVQSTTVDVLVKDDLPVLLGDRSHTPDGPGSALQLGGPIRVDLSSTSRVDVKDLLFDPDGDAITVLAIDNENGQYDQGKDGSLYVPLGFTETASIHTPLAGTLPMLGNISPFANVGTPVTTWQRGDSKFLRALLLGDSTIDLHNPLKPTDVQSSLTSRRRWNPDQSTNGNTLRLLVNDGRVDATGAHIVRPVEIEIAPVSKFESRSLASDLETQPFVQGLAQSLEDRHPEEDSGGLITEMQADDFTSVSGRFPAVPRATDESLWSIDALDISQNRRFEDVGGTAVDLVGGTFLVHHELILDQSGGNSELALPGLLYDSSTVFDDNASTPVIQAEIFKPIGTASPNNLTATLTWFDHVNQNGNAVNEPYGRPIVTETTFDVDWNDGSVVIALPVAEAPMFSGLYSWTLQVDVGNIQLTQHGQTPIIVNQSVSSSEFGEGSPHAWDHTASFGEGWALAGVPSVVVDRDHRSANSSDAWNPDGQDDRLLLSFPGQTPLVFDYSVIMVNKPSYPIIMPAIESGTKTNSKNGNTVADADFYGTLTAINAEELVYKTGDGTEYIFEKFAIRPNPSADPVHQFLINRIEQPGIDFDPTINIYETNPSTTKRQGVVFERVDDPASPHHGRLTAIIASDGARTNLDYAAEGTVDRFVTLTETQPRTVDFTVVSGLLESVLHENISPVDRAALPVDDAVRKFTYANGQLTGDQWTDANDAIIRNTQFRYVHDLAASGGVETGLSHIQFGSDTHGPYLPGQEENSPNYKIVPAVLAGLQSDSATRTANHLIPLTGEIHISPGYQSEAATPSADQSITRFSFDNRGMLSHREQRIGPDSTSSTLLNKQSWTYNAIGDVFESIDAIDRTTTFHYDYEIPLDGKSVGGSVYDKSDYRGNVTEIVSTGKRQIFEYETDNAKVNAVGTLKQSYVLSNDERYLETNYQRANDGRVLQILRPDFAPEIWHYHANFGQLQWHQTPAGLRTTFDTYENAKVTESNSTDQYDPTDDGSTAMVSTTYTTFDEFGFVDRIMSAIASEPPVDSQIPSDPQTLSVTDLDFDALGNLRHRTLRSPSGSIVSEEGWEYAVDGRVIAHIDAAGVRTQSRFDQSGLLTQTIAAVGQTFAPHFGPTSQNLEQTTNYAYYGDGSLWRVTQPDGTKRHTYIDPVNFTTWQSIDSVAGNSTIADGGVSIIQNNTHITKTITDKLGRPIETEDLTTGLKTFAKYDDKRVDSPTETSYETIASITPDALATTKLTATSTHRYDAFGNVVWSKDPVGRITSTKYTPTSLLPEQTRSHAAHGAQYDFTYTDAGQLKTSTETRRSAGQPNQIFKTTHTYDQSGRLRSVEDPLHGIEPGVVAATTDYAVDADGLRIISRNRTGQETTQWLDAAGNVRREQNSLGGNTHYVYNTTGTLHSVQFVPRETNDTSKNRTSTFAYDALGRVRSQTITDNTPPDPDATPPFFPPQPITTYTDHFLPDDTAIGWDIATTNGDGHTTTAIYDSLGQPIATVGAAVGRDTIGPDVHPVTLITYEHDDATHFTKQTNLLTAAHLASGQIAADANYEQRRQTTSYLSPSGSVLMSQTELRAGGAVSGAGNLATNIEYDAIGRPLTTTRLDASAGNTVTTQTYDDASSGTGLVATTHVDGRPAQSKFYLRDSAGNLVRLSDDPDADVTDANFVQNWTYDALSRPLTHSELVNQVDESGNKTNASEILTRYWSYQGLSTDYHDRTGQVTTTTIAHGTTPTVTESSTHPDLGTFTATTHLNSDGSIRQATQNVDGLDASDPIQPSTSSVSFFYNALGQQIRDIQQHTLDGDATPEFKMEYAYHNSGPLKKIVRKVAGDRVTETSYGIDAAGNVTSILDHLLADANGENTHWVNNDPGDTRFIELFYDIDSSIDAITRYLGSSNSGQQRGHTNYEYRSDGATASVNHRRSDSTGSGGELISASSKLWNPSGSLHLTTNKVNDDAVTAFINEEYRYEHNLYDAENGLHDKITFHNLAENAAPDPQIIQRDSSGNETHGATTGKGNRIYQESIPGGTRNYQYDREGRVIQTKDALSETVGPTTTTTTITVDNTWDHRGRLIVVERHFEKLTITQHYSSQTTSTHATENSSKTLFYFDALNRRIGREETTWNASGQVTSVKATAIAYDQTGKAFEVVLNGGLNQIDRNYLNGPTGIIAIDQGDWTSADGIVPTTTAWVLNDVDGNASVVASVDSTGTWQSIQRRFARQGKVTQTHGATGNAALSDVPVIWHGMERDDVSQLYLTATAGIGSDAGLVSYHQPGAVSAWSQFDPMSYYMPNLDGPTRGFVGNFIADYKHYFNPQNSLDEGGAWNTAVAYTQTGGWIAAATAGGALGGSALLAGGAGVTTVGVSGWATAGSVAGAAGGIASTYAYDPSAGLGSYAIGGAFGGLTGGINPAGSIGGLALGGAGAAIGGRTGYLAGEFIGGMAGGAYGMGKAAIARGGSLGYATMSVAPGLAGGAAGFGYGYSQGGINSALLYGAIGNGLGDLGSARFIKCFVAGTPVYVPVNPDEQMAFAAIAASTTDVASGAGWRLPVGIGAAAIGMAAFAMLEHHATQARQRREEQSYVLGEQNDAVFGGEDSWLDPIDLLWGGVERAEARVAEFRWSLESSADEIAGELTDWLLPARTRFS